MHLPALPESTLEAVASRAIGALMLTTAGFLALMQEASESVPVATADGLLQMVMWVLSVGGIGSYLIKFGVTQWSKAKEAERAEDERRHADYKEIEARLAQVYESNAANLRAQLDLERGRSERCWTALHHALPADPTTSPPA